MTRKLIYLTVLSIFFISLKSQPLNVIRYTFRDKTETLFLKDASSKNTEVSLCFRVGPYLETASNTGISRALIFNMTRGLAKLNPKFATPLIGFSQGYSMLRFQNLETQDIIQLLGNVFKPSLLDSNTFEASKQKALKSFDLEPELSPFDLKVYKYLWKDYLFRIKSLKSSQQLKDISFQESLNYFSAYVLPQNAFLLVKSPTDPYDMIDKISPYLAPGDPTRNTYISLGKTNIYRNLINSIQFIEKDKANLNQNSILAWQINNDNRSNSNYLNLLILSDVMNMAMKNEKLKSTGITDLSASVTLNRFACELRMDFNLANDQINTLYDFKKIIDETSIENLVSQKEFDDIIQKRVSNYNKISSNPDSARNEIIYWWNLATTQDYLSVGSSLNQLKRSDLQYFFAYNIQNKPTVFGLSQASGIPSPVTLVETNDTLIAKNIYFSNNVSDVETKEAQEKINSITQFLLINKDVNVQVNGYADLTEYIRVQDTSLRSFVEQYPQFKVLSSNPAKATWQRLDMIRALKIVRYFVENGVEADRIIGTGKIYSSEERSEASSNRKVSFLFDKVRRTKVEYSTRSIPK